MKKEILFLRKRRIKFLKEIGRQENLEKPLTKLYFGIYVGSCGFKITKEFEEAGLITTIKIGRERHVKLTKKGKEILKNFNKINKILIWD